MANNKRNKRTPIRPTSLRDSRDLCNGLSSGCLDITDGIQGNDRTRVIQDFAIDEQSNYIYTTQVSDGDEYSFKSVVVNKLDIDGNHIDILTDFDGVSEDTFGHGQGISVEDGTGFLWISNYCLDDDSPGNTIAPGCKVQRIHEDSLNNADGYAGTTTDRPAYTGDWYKLFTDDYKSMTTNLSADRNHLVAFAKHNDTSEGVVKLFSISDFVHGCLDECNNGQVLDSIYNFSIGTLGNGSTEQEVSHLQQGLMPYLQGIGYHDGYVYCLHGYNNVFQPKFIDTWIAATGERISRHATCQGYDWAVAGSYSHYEPEGLDIIYNNGNPLMYIGLMTGDDGDRQKRLYHVPINELTVPGGDCTSQGCVCDSVPLEMTAGDLNEDGVINVSDVIVVVNHILEGMELTQAQQQLADMDQNGLINITDVVMIVQQILGITTQQQSMIINQVKRLLRPETQQTPIRNRNTQTKISPSGVRYKITRG